MTVQDVLSLLQLIVLVVSAIYVGFQVRFAGKQVHLMGQQVILAQNSRDREIRMDAQNRALVFVARFNSEYIVKLRQQAVISLREFNNSGETADIHSIHAYLNFFYEVALSVMNNLADEDICFRFFRRPFLAFYTLSEKFLQESEPTGGYLYLRDLQQKWQQRSPEPIEPLP